MTRYDASAMPNLIESTYMCLRAW